MATLRKILMMIMMVTCISMLLIATASASSSRGISVQLRTSEKAGAPSAGKVQLYNQSHALVIGTTTTRGAGRGCPMPSKMLNWRPGSLKTKGLT